MAVEYDNRQDTPPPGVQRALDKARQEVAGLINGEISKISGAARKNLSDRHDDPSVRPYWELMTSWETGQQQAEPEPIRTERIPDTRSQSPTVEADPTEPLRIRVLSDRRQNHHPYYNNAINTIHLKVALGDDTIVDLSGTQTLMLEELAKLPRGKYIAETELDRRVFAGQDVSVQRMHTVRTRLLQKVNGAVGHPLIDFQPGRGKTARLGIIGRKVSFVPIEQNPTPKKTDTPSQRRGSDLFVRTPRHANG